MLGVEDVQVVKEDIDTVTWQAESKISYAPSPSRDCLSRPTLSDHEGIGVDAYHCTCIDLDSRTRRELDNHPCFTPTRLKRLDRPKAHDWTLNDTRRVNISHYLTAHRRVLSRSP
jgi:hypothetical protein